MPDIGKLGFHALIGRAAEKSANAADDVGDGIGVTDGPLDRAHGAFDIWRVGREPALARMRIGKNRSKWLADFVGYGR